MPCYHPIMGYRSIIKTLSGKRKFTTNVDLAHQFLPMQIPCGVCWGCRLEKSRTWAARCVKEASMHKDNCFVTLTYKKDPHSLNRRDFELFRKRLQKRCGPFRYYQCGEYGPKNMRPHHHVILFGLNFPDRYHWETVKGQKLFRSDTLEKTWVTPGKNGTSLGFSRIGEVNFESCAYVARYCTKVYKSEFKFKVQEHYEKVIPETGEVINCLPEYATMSRGNRQTGPAGIAYEWYKKYKDDVYPNDLLYLKGQIKMKPPGYFDYLHNKTNPEQMEQVKLARRKSFDDRKEEYTPERMRAKEQLALSKLKRLKRSYENDEKSLFSLRQESQNVRSSLPPS